MKIKKKVIRSFVERIFEDKDNDRMKEDEIR